VTPDKLGKYQLIRKIASGGMAEIYLAKVSGLSGFEKLVVVKRILPQLSGDSQFIQMFLDEARIAATLQHPNIVQMYDIGAADGEYFISMEYIHGEDVRSIMRRLKQNKKGLPLDHALNIVSGVASGLHYAHEKRAFDGRALGIVHRDVNPQNVLVSYDGAVKLVDFGIAKASNRLNEETRHGTLKGKIPYMSPEQCQGHPFDRRSDIYALGIMLYELTTGMRLYRGESDFEIMKQIVEEPVMPPTVRRPGYPTALEKIVLKALAKKFDPESEEKGDLRYQTARELQADLEAYIREKRLMTSDIALSSFMRETFEDRIEAWQAAATERERAAVVAGKAEGSKSGSGVALEFDDDHASHSSATVASYTPNGSGEVGNAPTTDVRGGGGRGLWIAVAALLLLGIGGGAYWMSRGKGGDGDKRAARAEVPTRNDTKTKPTAETGAAMLASEPRGATVIVDGSEWHEKTPTTVKGLAAGMHKLTFELAAHSKKTVEFHVSAGAVETVSVELAKLHVADTKKTDDKKKKATTKHHRRRVNKRRRVTKKTPDKKPPKKVEKGTGTLRIASSPSCTVIINGRSRGATPIARIELPAGRHRVQLINARFKIDRRYTVVIKAGQMTKRRYTFPVGQ
jgi:serine/threonine protein kinase